MLIKKGRIMMNRILKPFQLNIRTRSAPAAILLASYVLLFGAPLHAQDLLLKEYIYLNGKLLAVERQVLTQAAQQPAGDSGKELKFAQYSFSGIYGWTRQGSYREPGISGISGMQETCAFHGAALARFLYPYKKQSSLGGCEYFTLQYDAYRWDWRIAGIFEHGNGGSYDGL